MPFKLKQALSNTDLFGHRISLNLNRKGDVHNSAIGGLVSVLYVVTMLLYASILFDKLRNFEADFTNASPISAAYDGEGNHKDNHILFDEMQMGLVHYIYHFDEKTGYRNPVDTNTEWVKKHIKIRFAEKKRDWTIIDKKLSNQWKFT